MRDGYWDELVSCGDTFTCYSSALAAWAAAQDACWRASLRTGLHLVITDDEDGLFGFSHFPGGLSARLGVARYGAGDRDTAVAAIRERLATDGRVIVSGDGFHLPWHVATGRRHVPHWFTLVAGPDGPEVIDPFECRTELGLQRATRLALSWDELALLVEGVPQDDPVLALREAFALGADDRGLLGDRFRWLAAGPPDHGSEPARGATGPQALRRLARHFVENGTRADAYRQADDLWSVARHRAFFAHQGELEGGDIAVAEQLAALVTRWSHIAPLLMQARLGVDAGRTPSSSLPDALTDLAQRESAVDS